MIMTDFLDTSTICINSEKHLLFSYGAYIFFKKQDHFHMNWTLNLICKYLFFQTMKNTVEERLWFTAMLV